MLYKLRGPHFPLNFGLDQAERDRLDNMTFDDLMHEFHPTGTRGSKFGDYWGSPKLQAATAKRPQGPRGGQGAAGRSQRSAEEENPRFRRAVKREEVDTEEEEEDTEDTQDDMPAGQRLGPAEGEQG